MSGWELSALAAFAILAGTAAYVFFRWRRGPIVRRAMLAVGAASFLAGLLLGLVLFHALLEGRGGATREQPSLLTQSGEKFGARVVSVTDGDTFAVIRSDGTQLRIRPIGIDAPESAQRFGWESTHNLEGLISGKMVTLQCTGQDRYDRYLCRVFLPNGEDVALDQVKAGMAWHYKQYQDQQSPFDSKAYADAECAALKAKVGLWSDPNPIEPQDFRHGTSSPLQFDANGCRVGGEPPSGPVVGNPNSKKFHWPGCPDYPDVANSGVQFPSAQAAVAAGYEPAHNCP